MSNNSLSLPSNCALISDEEMVYLDGGVQVLPASSSVLGGVASFAVAFCQVIWDSLKSCARSFVEITLDDLRNPNFQAVLAVVSVACVISFLAK